MCGIAGIVALDGQRRVEAADLKAMAAALRHRGPDDEGVLIDGSIGLTMRRLSVIDVAGGRQPIRNEDGSVAVVQNGEIYNFRDLRDDLSSRGHRFTTASDTETIVHLYEETGPTADLPARLHGMFAFAIYDSRRQLLVLARDRAGKKPLYIYRDRATLAFASELGALFAPRLALDASIDPAAVDAYLALQYVPGPGTIRSRARHLPPATCLILERAASGWAERPERRYWSLPAAPAGEGAGWTSFGRAVEGCERLLVDAVRRRLESDVPLGAFLSGGLDSSLVVALMTRLGAGPVRTFSIGFEDAALDESAAARFVAARLGARPSELRMPAPQPHDLKAILAGCDQPLADPAVVPTWHLSKMARQTVTVALSGEGADEVFGGYHWYRPSPLSRLLRPATRGEAAARELYHRREQESDSARRDLLAPALREALRTAEAGAARRSFEAAGRAADGISGIAAMQAIDFTTWMADDLLVKVDRTSMAHGLEVRCPYLDHRLVEAVLPGPDRFKIRWGRRKALLKAVARRHLPDEVIRRKKHGFQVPVDTLLRGPLRELLGDLAAPERLRRDGLLDAGAVAALVARWQGDPTRARAVWKILCLQVWSEANGGAAA